MQKTISYEPFCVDGYLIVPQEEKKITFVYNIINGAPVFNALELSALPKQVSLNTEFERQVFDILNKSGLYRSEESLRNSFFTPFKQKNGTDREFDSSVLLRLSPDMFVWYLLDLRESNFGSVHFANAGLKNSEFMHVITTRIGEIEDFKKQIAGNIEFKRVRS